MCSWSWFTNPLEYSPVYDIISLYFSVVSYLYYLAHKHNTVLFWKNGVPENIMGLIQKVAMASVAYCCFLIFILNHLQKNQGQQRGHKGDLSWSPDAYFLLFFWYSDNINKAKHSKRGEEQRNSSDLTANKLSGILSSNHGYTTITLNEATSYKTDPWFMTILVRTHWDLPSLLK